MNYGIFNKQAGIVSYFEAVTFRPHSVGALQARGRALSQCINGRSSTEVGSERSLIILDS